MFLFQLYSVPDDFADMLDFYTREGFRVLALACKTLDNAIDWEKVMDISRYEYDVYHYYRI